MIQSVLILIIMAIVSSVLADLRGFKTEGAPKSTRTPTIAPILSPVTITYNCPSSSSFSVINANLGGVIDRLNFRCNDGNHSQTPDIGVPLAYVTSPKSKALSLPPKQKYFDYVAFGYAWYAPYDKWVLASTRACSHGVCADSFFQGLTVCTANPNNLNDRCPRLEIYNNEGIEGKKFTGLTATYVTSKKRGYIESIIPVFTQI